jgi:hypothetical protein
MRRPKDGAGESVVTSMKQSTGRAAALAIVAVGMLSTAGAEAQRRGEPAEGDSRRPTVTVAQLDTVTPKLESADADEVREALDLLVAMDDARVVGPIAELLRSGRRDRITDRALNALKVLASPRAIEVLAEFRHHRRAGARRRAYQALAAIEDRRIPGLLERGLRDSDRSVRGAAALALGEVGSEANLEILFVAFERNVVEAAIAIGKLGNEASIDRYTEFLGREPLGVMLSGYHEYLRRDDIGIEKKTEIVERLGEVSGTMVRRFLQEYLGTFPDGRIRDRQVRELEEVVEQTIRRIPAEGGGVTMGGGQ